MSSFYLTTTAALAQEFLEHRENAVIGRRPGPDVAYSKGPVVLTDRPVDARYGVAGDIIFEVQLMRGERIDRYERKDASKPYRQWSLPLPVFLRLLKRMHIV